MNQIKFHFRDVEVFVDFQFGKKKTREEKKREENKLLLFCEQTQKIFSLLMNWKSFKIVNSS